MMMHPERFDKRAFADAGHARDAEAHRMPLVKGRHASINSRARS
jgi:hypothetical protein